MGRFRRQRVDVRHRRDERLRRVSTCDLRSQVARPRQGNYSGGVLPVMIPTAFVVIPLMTVFMVLMVWGYQVAKPGTALIVSKGSAQRVVFEGGVFVMPGFGRFSTIDLGERRLTLRFDADRPLTDGVTGALELRLRPGASADEVLRLASDLGAERANDVVALEKHFDATIRASARAHAAGLSASALGGPELGDRMTADLNEKLGGFRVENVSFTLA